MSQKHHNGRRWRRPERGAGALRYRDLDFDLVIKMKGEKPHSTFLSDGCSGAPDWAGPIDIRSACFFHDFAYAQGGSESHRREADANLWRNIRACGGSWWLATIYWLEVRRFGFSHFRYHGLSKPGWWQRKWIIWVTRWFVFFAA